MLRYQPFTAAHLLIHAAIIFAAIEANSTGVYAIILLSLRHVDAKIAAALRC